MKKLTMLLKKHLKNNVADIFIIGSYLKDKLEPRDIDILILFKEKNMREVEEVLYRIKEDIGIKDTHIEPLFYDSFLLEGISLTILHEGFSIRHNKSVSEILKLRAYSLFSYKLENLSIVEKVRFAQALYGRNKDGLIYIEKGIVLGQGSFMIPVEKEEIFKELMKEWKIKYDYKRIFVNH